MTPFVLCIHPTRLVVGCVLPAVDLRHRLLLFGERGDLVEGKASVLRLGLGCGGLDFGWGCRLVAGERVCVCRGWLGELGGKVQGLLLPMLLLLLLLFEMAWSNVHRVEIGRERVGTAVVLGGGELRWL